MSSDERTSASDHPSVPENVDGENPASDTSPTVSPTSTEFDDQREAKFMSKAQNYMERMKRLEQKNLELGAKVEDLTVQVDEAKKSKEEEVQKLKKELDDSSAILSEILEKIISGEIPMIAEETPENETEAKLRKQISELELQLDEMMASYENQLEAVKTEHVKEVHECLVRHEEELEEMIRNCKTWVNQLNSDFQWAEKNNSRLSKTNVQTLYNNFSALSDDIKVVIAVVMDIVVGVLGAMASWKFISWLWTTLVNKATLIRSLLSIGLNLTDFISSNEFKRFMQAWKEDKSIIECVKCLAPATQLLKSCYPMGVEIIKGIKMT